MTENLIPNEGVIRFEFSYKRLDTTYTAICTTNYIDSFDQIKFNIFSISMGDRELTGNSYANAKDFIRENFSNKINANFRNIILAAAKAAIKKE